MSETIAAAGFGFLFVMIGVWFVLISWLFRRLRKHHASVYEELGSPSLFWNNSMRNSWLFMRFLLGSRWRELGDPATESLCRFMRVFFVVYLLLLLGLLVFFAWSGASSS